MFSRIKQAKPSKISPYWRILFISILASFGGFIAYDYFATPALHGIINGDIIILFSILLLPQKNKFKLILLLGSIITTICFNPVVGFCMLYTTCISFTKRNSLKKTIILVTPLISFSIISECATFFKKSFMMNLPQIWEVSSFFWWGTILFFLIPSGYTALIIHFSKKILIKQDLILKPLFATAVILLTLYANVIFTSFQNRMYLIDFPIYHYFGDYNIHKPFGKIEPSPGVQEETLSGDTKKIFAIWNPKENNTLRKKSVFILVESYGVSKDTTIAKHMIFAPFKKANVSFAGILPRHSMYTQGAELEDLGNIYYQDSTTIPLISSMKSEHIESYFIHGYVESFYSRKEKYHHFGFDSLLFINEIKERNYTICRYGFEGICDTSMINLIGSILYRPGDKFVFWTTLDSHPPYKGNLNLPSYSVFCKNSTISDKMCVYLSLIENTLKDIVKLAQEHPDYQFVIRGDHRPMATINPDDFYYAWVPMIILN